MSDLPRSEWQKKHDADVAYWHEWAERFPSGMVPSPAFQALWSEVEPLIEALEFYGRHDSQCDKRFGHPCSCGFDDALARVRSPEEGVSE